MLWKFYVVCSEVYSKGYSDGGIDRRLFDQIIRRETLVLTIFVLKAIGGLSIVVGGLLLRIQTAGSLR